MIARNYDRFNSTLVEAVANELSAMAARLG
jgi:hypothetical protein